MESYRYGSGALILSRSRKMRSLIYGEFHKDMQNKNINTHLLLAKFCRPLKVFQKIFLSQTYTAPKIVLSPYMLEYDPSHHYTKKNAAEGNKLFQRPTLALCEPKWIPFSRYN